MSIYIGNNGSEKILHIYDGDTNVRTDNFSGTSFHSSLPYIMTADRYVFYPNGSVPCSGSYNSAATWTSAGYTCSTPIPADPSNIIFTVCIGYVGSDRYFFPSTRGATRCAGEAYGNSSGGTPAFVVSGATTGYVYQFNSAAFWGPAGYPLVSFSKIEIIYFKYFTAGNIASDINISRSDISINGISIFNNSYVHFMSSISDRINDYDDIIAIPVGANNVVQNGAYILQPNWVTSSSNISFTSGISGGQYKLIQIINSYPHAKTSVEINGQLSTISVLKNGIMLPQFKGASAYKTYINGSFSYTKIISAGQQFSYYSSGYANYLVATIPISAVAGNLVLMSVKGIGFSVVSPVSSIGSVGDTVYLYAAERYSFLKAVIGGSSISIYYTGYDAVYQYTPGGHQWICDVYVSVFVIS